MNGTNTGIWIVIGAHPRHQHGILGHLEMTRKMSGMKMTGTVKADLRTTLNSGSQERSGIN
jgi:hypothetical protein